MAGWALAVDIGVVSTTAAVQHDGRATVVEFANSTGAAMPSAVYLGADGILLTGTSAGRRMVEHPERVVRSPRLALAVGVAGVGLPLSRVFAAILGTVARQAAPAGASATPAELILTTPSGWGRREVATLTQAAALAGLPAPRFVPEPVAAACRLAESSERGDPVAIVHVDASTVDVALLRRTSKGFVVLGTAGGGIGRSSDQPELRLRRGLFDLLKAMHRANIAPGQLHSLHIVGDHASGALIRTFVPEILGISPQPPNPEPSTVLGALAAVEGIRTSAPRPGQIWRSRSLRTRMVVAGLLAIAVVISAAVVSLTLRSPRPADPIDPAALAPGCAAAQAQSVAPTYRLLGLVKANYILYIASNETGSVLPLFTATDTLGKPIPVGPHPTGLTITPDGRTVYVRQAGPTITPINTTTEAPGAPILLPGPANQLAITRDAKTAYAITTMDSGVNQLIPINVATGATGTTITLTGGAVSMAIAPDSRTVYVTEDGGTTGQVGTLTAINTADNIPRRAVRVGQRPVAIAVASDSRTVYVANGGTASVGRGSVTPVNPATNVAGQPIDVVGNPVSMAITPNGRTLYVVSANATLCAGATVVTPIDTQTLSAGPTILVLGSGPRSAVVVTSDGRHVYLYGDDGADAVGWIDTANNAVGRSIRVGVNPAAIAFAPDGLFGYVVKSGRADDPDTTLVPIDLTTNTAGTPIKLPPGAEEMAIAP